MHSILLSVVLLGVGYNEKPKVVVTGATGGTGQLLYAQLKADTRIGEVRGLVHSSSNAKEKAKKALNCSACDASEGIYYGDVTNVSTLNEAFKSVDTVAIAVGADFLSNKTLQKLIEFTGVENQVAALAASGADRDSLRVVLCSSMATTDPHPSPFEGGPILFWKLNAEAFLGNSGVGSTIVKPCGIEGTYGRGGKQLLVGHDDKLPARAGAISRADVAAVMAEAVAQRYTDLRFDLCIGNGPATTDLAKLIESAKYPWNQ
jgi:uncharacterized protein YbjT (DUF2867 family)